MKQRHTRRLLIKTCFLLGVSTVAPVSIAGESINLGCQALVFTKGADIPKSAWLENFAVHIHRNTRPVAVDVSGETHIQLHATTSANNTPERRQLLQINESEFNVETSLAIKGRYEKQILQINSSGKLIYTSWIQKDITVNAEGKCDQPWLLFAPLPPLAPSN